MLRARVRSYASRHPVRQEAWERSLETVRARIGDGSRTGGVLSAQQFGSRIRVGGTRASSRTPVYKGAAHHDWADVRDTRV